MENLVRYKIKKCNDSNCDACIILDDNGDIVSFEQANTIHEFATNIIMNYKEILCVHGCCNNALTGI